MNKITKGFKFTNAHFYLIIILLMSNYKFFLLMTRVTNANPSLCNDPNYVYSVFKTIVDDISTY